ncbi:MAG: nucleotidyl transferase AbiEii/AbiGii toxin family protein [Pseudomonadota bacterium]
MYEKTLPTGSKDLLAKLEALSSPYLNGWVLAGGTGLALQIGHRKSEDFDFFRQDSFLISNIHNALRQLGTYETLQEDEKTLSVIISNIKLSFFCVSDPFVFETKAYRFFSLADIRDIALMKLIAISGRGSRKDFVDLYSILRRGHLLQDFFNLIPKKYGEGRSNTHHILKSLTYFDDAEKEPIPEMLEPFEWNECKNFFIRQAHAIVLPAM